MRAVAAAAAVAAAGAADPTVTLPHGGSLTGVDVYGGSTFLGIPYAAAPVGDLRWMPPAAAKAWKGSRSATEFAASCMGSKCNGTTSEDCLFLNVFTPPQPVAASKKLPVMLWVHGGGYQTGCSNVYSGPGLVRSSQNSVIVVTVNYRLNVFGFLGSSDLVKGDSGTGNYGIQDQRAAMKWAQDNIAAFGGDPDNILIFGESAGGNSQMQHLSQKASWPYYSKVVVESGTYHGSTTLASAEQNYASLAKTLGCKDAACMRAAPAAKVAGGKGSGPVVDGVNLLKPEWEVVAAGEHNTKVPIMLGSNRDEAAFFIILAAGQKNLTELEFDVAMAAAAPGKLKDVKKAYDPANYPYPANLGQFNHWWWASMRVSTDAPTSLGACSVRRTARHLSDANPNVWAYLHAHPLQQAIPGVPGTGPGSAVVPHASEIMFVFDCGTPDQPQCANDDEQKLGDAMSQYWIRFAKAGDPNGDGAVQWEKFTTEADNVLRFETESESGIQMQTGLRKAACDFWEAEAPDAKGLTP